MPNLDHSAAHETGHFLGNIDEYQANVSGTGGADSMWPSNMPRFLSFLPAGSANSVMNNELADAKSRHFQRIKEVTEAELLGPSKHGKEVSCEILPANAP